MLSRELRLKEWDYYFVLISASIIDLKDKEETAKSVVRVVTKEKFNMPESSEIEDIV